MGLFVLNCMVNKLMSSGQKYLAVCECKLVAKYDIGKSITIC